MNSYKLPFVSKIGLFLFDNRITSDKTTREFFAVSTGAQVTASLSEQLSVIDSLSDGPK